MRSLTLRVFIAITVIIIIVIIIIVIIIISVIFILPPCIHITLPLPFSANGAHYMAPADNPFAARGMACEYCYFYQPDGQCAIVEGIIEEYAVCKLWVIPEAVLMVEPMEAVAEPVMEAEPAMEDMEAVAMSEYDEDGVMALDTPLTIKVGDEVKALARRLLGAQQ